MTRGIAGDNILYRPRSSNCWKRDDDQNSYTHLYLCVETNDELIGCRMRVITLNYTFSEVPVHKENDQVFEAYINSPEIYATDGLSI